MYIVNLVPRASLGTRLVYRMGPRALSTRHPTVIVQAKRQARARKLFVGKWSYDSSVCEMQETMACERALN